VKERDFSQLAAQSQIKWGELVCRRDIEEQKNTNCSTASRVTKPTPVAPSHTAKSPLAENLGVCSHAGALFPLAVSPQPLAFSNSTMDHLASRKHGGTSKRIALYFGS
jgi:hypothetical protein